MSLSQIGKNGVNEFFEDLTYNVAYNEVLSKLKNVVNMEDGAIKDAIESSLTIMVSSALFLYIQKQEAVLNKIVEIVWGVLKTLFVVIGGSFIGKFAAFKGRKLKNIMNFAYNNRSEAIGASRLAIEIGNFTFSKSVSSNANTSMIMPSVIKQGQIIQDQEHKLNIARSKVQSINETLLFKLFTKNFTANDIALINRMTGGKGEKITKEQLNQVADFMYVTDSNGNITGLSEEFMKMLNGLGYLHNKARS